MSPSSERIQASTAISPLLAWLSSQVLKLPSDARSSLKVDFLSLVGFTDVRRGTHGNQDRIAAAYSIDQNGPSNWFLAVVCDGVGGSLFGERAAAMTIASMALDLADMPLMSATGSLQVLLQQAHARTSAAFHCKSSTTAVALLVTDKTAAIGWVGDSRAFQISEGKAVLLTIDDTLAGAMAKTDSQYKFELNDEYAEKLTQAIGGDNSVVPNVASLNSAAQESFFILCSDGIWKPSEPAFDAMVEACRDGSELMRRLLLVSDWMGGLDNASAVLVPPISSVRKFISDPANATPFETFAICLPGPLQLLVPAHGLRGRNNALRSRNQNESVDEAPESTPSPKKQPNKRKVSGSVKGRQKEVAASASQLVIAEEPIDDTSPQPAIKIRDDGTPS